MIADFKANPKQQPRLIHREQSMAEQVSVTGGVVEQVARIVGSYVRHHQIEPGQLVRLIGEVHRALSPTFSTGGSDEVEVGGNGGLWSKSLHYTRLG